MEIIVGENAGYCFGVERAVDIIKEALEELDEDVYSLGPIIHNPQTNQLLANKGLNIVKTLDEIGEGTLVIRSHGLDPEIIESAKNRGLNIVDATCPLVKKVQEYAEFLHDEGYRVIIFGDKEHPEIKAVSGFTDNTALVIKDERDLNNIGNLDKVGVVIQTTQSLFNYKSAIFELIKMSDEFRIYNTICNATEMRQEETYYMAKDVDIMLIVGGKDSANTTRLKEVAEDVKCRAYHIEDVGELEGEWFERVEKIGIMGGASTPRWIIDKVVKFCEGLE